MSNERQDDKQLIAIVPKIQFGIGLLLIVMTVIAAFGISLNYYVRAVTAIWKSTDTTEIGVFAIVAAMIPTVFLVVASWFLKFTSWFLKIIRS